MSDEKKSGIFVSKKAAAATPAAPASPAKPKDVQRRWMYVGVGVIGLVVVSSSLFSSKKPAAPTTKKDDASTAMVSVTPPSADKAAFEAKFAKDMEVMKQELERQKADLASKEKTIAELKSKPATVEQTPAGVVAPPKEGQNTSALGGLNAVAPPPTPITRGQAPMLQAPPSIAMGTGRTPELPSVPMTVPSSGGSDPMVFDAPARNGGASAGVAGGDVQAGGQGVNAKVRYQKNANAGILPAGAFASVSLLNGLDAGTSSATQSNPMPVLLNVTDQATLPGAAKYRLKSCFVLGTGYGDLSAERVYVRFSRLSCVDKTDRLVLSQEVQGYLVDSDGKLGMRGVVYDRQGAKLGKAMLAGFAQGLTGALGSAQGSTTSNATTGMTTSSITGGAVMRASGLSGAQSAAQTLADFYLKEAQAIFPVISIDAGRTGTIVFSASATLSWTNGDSQYVQQVTPN